MFASLSVFALLAIQVSTVSAFPQHQSLAGLTREELDAVLPTLRAFVPPPSPPGPLADDSAILVADAAHPFITPGPDDQRGPCPALNTLASHGYLNRTGIVTPAEIVDAVQQALNLENTFARFLTYSTFLVNGNPITNLMSIGGASAATGPNPPKPATVSGLDTHNNCEGDTSMTRLDTFFGDNHSFNPSRFANFANFSNMFGGGFYNLTAAQELRKFLFQDSVSRNPTFSIGNPRLFTAYAEAIFPINFFIDGRQTDGQLSLENALNFFANQTFPNDFFRHNGAISNEGSMDIFDFSPIQPGANQNGVNTFVANPNLPNLTEPCERYTDFVNTNIVSLYPNPTGVLKQALNINLQFLFDATDGDNCTQVFPFGK